MPPRTAVGTTAIVLGVVIVVAAIGVLFLANQANPGGPPVPITVSTQSTTSGVSIRTIISSPSTTGQPTSSGSVTTSAALVCYQGALPANSSASGAPSTYSRTVFNVTQEFDSWSWTSLSTFTVGSYTFMASAPASSQNAIQLEPQLFVNVTDSQGQVQKTSVTDLGGIDGQVWPPDMSLEQTLFGGNVTIQWLFLCNSSSVFLEVTAQ
jgi:hypothetical protein